MTDVFEKLSKLENPNQDKNFYIYYDNSTGEIIHLRNLLIIDPDEHYPFIIINEKDFPTDFNLSNYMVDDRKDFPKLVKKIISDQYLNLTNIDDVIHRIKKEKIYDHVTYDINQFDYDFLIEQDFIKKEFRFRFSKNLQNIYKSDPLFKTKNINLYLTDVNDPNILYKSFTLSLYQISEYSFYTLKFDENINLNNDFYTSRYFPKYLHIVIKEKNDE